MTTASKKIANKMLKETNKYMRSQCRAINKQLIEESKPPKKESKKKANKNNPKKAQEQQKNNKRQIQKPVTVVLPIKIGFWIMMACYFFKTVLGF